MQPTTINVQCVYGSTHLPHLEQVFLPALSRSTKRPIRLLTINYDPASHARLQSGEAFGTDVLDVRNDSTKITGFATNHNRLFQMSPRSETFVIINPDCIPQEGAIDELLRRKEESKGHNRVAIVEGRQWPFEHPKEYDALSLCTPWASGAFALIDSDFYATVGGMDEVYFLYLEDVDLSWQAWLRGYKVLYEPAAMVAHFSGGKFYRDDLVSHEHALSLRNFLIISRKFFGQDGEQKAVAMVKAFADRELSDYALHEYFESYQTLVNEAYRGMRHPKVKILGLNQFHAMRVI